MKRIVLLVVAILAVGGGGFAAYYFFLAGEKVAGTESAPLYITLEPFIVPVIREGRIVKQVGFSIVLGVTDADAEIKVAEKMPYLRDAFLKRLYGAVGRSRRDGRTFSPELLKRRLLAESERVLGAGVVREILIKEAYEKTSRP